MGGIRLTLSEVEPKYILLLACHVFIHHFVQILVEGNIRRFCTPSFESVVHSLRAIFAGFRKICGVSFKTKDRGNALDILHILKELFRERVRLAKVAEEVGDVAEPFFMEAVSPMYHIRPSNHIRTSISGSLSLMQGLLQEFRSTTVLKYVYL